MTKVHESVHVLNFLYNHKDYAILDNAFSIIMKSFPEPIRLEIDSILQDCNKSQNSDWERVVLNLKEDGSKIVKNYFFRTALLVLFNNCKCKCPKIPKMSSFKRGVPVLSFTETPYYRSEILFKSIMLVLLKLRILKKVKKIYSFEKTSISVRKM